MGRATESAETWAGFLELWEALLSEGASPGTVILVEGERDVRALRRLGVEGPIRPLHRGQRLPVVARELVESARRVVLLTDWDAEGGRLAQRMRELLAPSAVEVDLELRRRLARCLRGEVVHLEGIYGWARRAAEREGAPLEHFHPLSDLGPAGVGRPTE